MDAYQLGMRKMNFNKLTTCLDAYGKYTTINYQYLQINGINLRLA